MALLYATHSGTGATDTHLYTVDPDTVAVTAVGDTGHFFTGLAFDPTTTVLYGVTGGGDINRMSLYVIDASTGGVALVGVLGGGLGRRIADIAFDAEGQLYGFDVFSRRLVTIDKATAAVVFLGPSGLTIDNGNGIAVDPTNDNIVWIFPDGGDGDVFNMNKTTGAATNLGTLNSTLTGSNIGAASFGPGGVLWVVGNNTTGPLATVSTTPDGFGVYIVTLVGHLPSGEPWDGLAWSGAAKGVSLPPQTLV